MPAEYPNLLPDDALLPLGIYNVKEIGGAIGNGVADDSTAIQATIDACEAAGGGTVFFPAGTYLVNTLQASNISWQTALVVRGDNVTLRGVGRASLLKSTVAYTSSVTLLAVNGASKPAGWATWGSYNIQSVANKALYPLAASTFSRGANQITLLNSADTAHFAAGDLIFIRTGQLLAPTLTEPDSETNTVLSVSGAAITLERPLAKDYAQEYYITGSSGVTNTTGAGTAAPFGVVNVSDRYVKNFALHDLAIDSTNQGIFLRQVKGIRISNHDSRTGRGFVVGGNYSDAQITQCRGHNTNPAYLNFATGHATGCTDVTFDHVDLYSDGFWYLHLHEGGARTRFLNGSVINAATGGSSSKTVDIIARGYDIGIDGNTFVNGGTGANNGIIYVQGSAPGGRGVDGGGYITNNTLYSSVATRGVFVGQFAYGWRVHGNDNRGAITADNIKEQATTRVAAGITLTGFASSLTDVDVLTFMGSPEGVIAANPGSIGLRQDGGAGTALYVKETGTGTTGWVAYVGHTNPAPGPQWDGIYTIDPEVTTAYAVIGAADRVIWTRLRGSGPVANISIMPSVLSGNVLVGIYANNGLTGLAARPDGAALAQSAVTAMSGLTTTIRNAIPLDVSVDVTHLDFWAALACDNNLATFARTGPAGSAQNTGMSQTTDPGSFTLPTASSPGAAAISIAMWGT